MAKVSRHHGVTSVILRVKLIQDSGATTPGDPLTGLTSASAGLIIAAIADVEAATVAYTGANLESIATLGTYAAPTSGKARFKEVDATNHAGLYEIQLADTRFSVSSATSLIVTISGATDLQQCDAEIDLRAASDLRMIGGDAQSATDLKDFADAGYDPGTNEVNATVDTSGLATQASVDVIDANVDAIKAKTDNLPTDPADNSDILAAIGGISAGDIADAVCDELLAGHTTPGSVGEALADAAAGTAVDGLLDDGLTLPGAEAVPASPSLRQAIAWNFKATWFKRRQTATQTEIMNSAGTTADHKAAVTKSSTEVTRAKFIAGP